MKNMTFSLFKILASNLYSFEDFIKNFKKGPKGIIKNIFIIILSLYCIGAFCFVYGISMYQTYCSLKMVNAEYLMPFCSVIYSCLIVVFFGILSVASNYFTASGEEQLLSLPLRPVNIFGAKFGVSYVTDALFGILMFAIGCFIYGINENLLTNPLFYIGFIVTAFSIPAICVFVIYFIFILFLTLFPKLRKKNLLTRFASFLGIGFGIGMGLMASTSVSDNTAQINSLITKIYALISKNYNFSKIVTFISGALSGKILPILVLLAISCLVVFVLIPLVSPLYVKTLNGFSDVKTKKINNDEAEQLIKEKNKVKSVFSALFSRDVKSILREPSFLANGPLVMILLPTIYIFIFVFTFINQGASFSKISEKILEFYFNATQQQLESAKYIVSFIIAGLIFFLGNSSSVACTSFSREGKSLYSLKALPINASTIVYVKFTHAFMYFLFAVLEVIIFFMLFVLALKIDFLLSFAIMYLILGILISVAVSVLLICIDMFIDTVHPKLNWENPIAVFKQNINTFFGFLLIIAVLFLSIVLCVFVLPKNNLGIFIFILIYTIIDIPVFIFYKKYAVNKFVRM